MVPNLMLMVYCIILICNIANSCNKSLLTVIGQYFSEDIMPFGMGTMVGIIQYLGS